MKNEIFALVIHTEQYAGNFQSQLLASITGVCDHPIAEPEAQAFKNEVKNFTLANHLCSLPRASGYETESHLHETPGWYNNGMGGHFKDDSPEQLAVHHNITNTINDEITHLNPVLEMLTTQKYFANWTHDLALGEVKRALEKIKTAIQKTSVSKYPAYLSMVVFFSKNPSEKELELMTKRAKEFGENNNITITGIEVKAMSWAAAKKLAAQT